MIHVKRIYDPTDESDGKRILVDRLWPRGISKEKAAIREWMKEVAPSHELRKRFHEHGNFDEFRIRYREELMGDPSKLPLLKQLRKWADEGTVTLLYSAKDEENNQAVFLAEIVRGWIRLKIRLRKKSIAALDRRHRAAEQGLSLASGGAGSGIHI